MSIKITVKYFSDRTKRRTVLANEKIVTETNGE